MFKYFTSLIKHIGIFLTNFTFTLICVPLALLPAHIRFENRVYFTITKLWCRINVLISGLRIVIKGKEYLPVFPENPSIIVANHSSSFDVYLMEWIIGSYPHIWLTKTEYLKIPIANILFKRLHVPVDRKNPKRAMQALVKMQHLLQTYKTHGLIFPEGTRYDDGKIHDFFIGFALLAHKLKRPVIPIYFDGLAAIFPKGKFLIDSKLRTVKIVIGKPMESKDTETAEEFKQRVRHWFIETSTNTL